MSQLVTGQEFSAVLAQYVRVVLRERLEFEQSRFRRDGRALPSVHREAAAFASALDHVEGSWRVSTGHGGSRLAGSVPAGDGGPDSSPMAVDLDEAGQLLGFSRSTVKRRIRAGKLQSMKDGGRHMVPVAAIEAYIEGLTR